MKTMYLGTTALFFPSVLSVFIISKKNISESSQFLNGPRSF